MASRSPGAPLGGDPLAEFDAAEKRVEAPDTAQKLEQASQRIAERTAEHENEARKVITRVVMIVYCLGLLLIAGFLIRLALISGEVSDTKEAIAQGFDLLKVAILPVVTLVIGYYIGQRRAGS